jgi:redox-sensitive bicupin YhaK (pirin superfamily)
MLDEMNIKKPAGFPDHPHRGFETVSYLIKGTFCHEDSCGRKGILNAGDLQWMTAGRGIVHSELPYDDQPCQGLQLWINLPAKHKMCEPTYQELKDAQIPRSSANGVHVKIIAGESMGIKSPVYTRTPSMYLDFKLDPGATFAQPVPVEWNAFVYILSGSGKFGPEGSQVEVNEKHTVVFGPGSGISFLNHRPQTQLHFVLIAGQPLNEPSKFLRFFFLNHLFFKIFYFKNPKLVVQHGPFVMNTEAEINQAFKDFQQGRNGFENAQSWLDSRNV